MRSEETIEVHIEKGMRDGEKLVFYGKGDQQPGLDPGNVIIVLDEEEVGKYCFLKSLFFSIPSSLAKVPI